MIDDGRGWIPWDIPAKLGKEPGNMNCICVWDCLKSRIRMKRRHHDLSFLLVIFVFVQKRVPTAPSVPSRQCQLLNCFENQENKKETRPLYIMRVYLTISLPLSAVSAILQLLRDWILYISRAMLSIFMDSLDTLLFCR